MSYIQSNHRHEHGSHHEHVEEGTIWLQCLVLSGNRPSVVRLQTRSCWATDLVLLGDTFIVAGCHLLPGAGPAAAISCLQLIKMS